MESESTLLEEIILSFQNPQVEVENVPPQNSDEIVPTKFEDLPYDILDQIFSYLDQEECQRLRELNQSFCQIIDSLYGLKIELSNENYQDLMVQDEKKITWVIFNNLTKPIEIPTPDKFLENVNTVEFHRQTLKQNLLLIFQNCPKLINLKFFDTVIDAPLSYDPNLAEQSWNLKKLTSITIQSKYDLVETGKGLIRHLHLFEIGILGSIEKIIYIYGNRPLVFPIQELFEIDDLLFIAYDPLIYFIWSQRKTVKYFEARKFSSLLNNDWRLLLKFEFYPCELKVEDNCPLELKHAIFKLRIELEWDFLRWQNNLKTLQVDQLHLHDQYWSPITCSIKNSRKTLEKLIIRGQDFAFWNCYLFYDCKKLVELGLEIQIVQKTGLFYLPISLTRLKIIAPIDKTELKSILKLVNLRTLIFENSSNLDPSVLQDQDQEYGPNAIIDLKLFLNFLLLPKLEYFELKNNFEPFYNYDPLLSWCAKYPQGLLFTQNLIIHREQRIIIGLKIIILQEFDRDFVRDFVEFDGHYCSSLLSFCTNILPSL